MLVTFFWLLCRVSSLEIFRSDIDCTFIALESNLHTSDRNTTSTLFAVEAEIRALTRLQAFHIATSVSSSKSGWVRN